MIEIKKMVTYAKISPKMVNPRDIAGERRRRRRRLISFKLGMMNEATKLHFDTSLDDLDLHSRSMCEISKSSAPIFSKISPSVWWRFSMLPQLVGLLKPMLSLFGWIKIQGRELC